MTLNELDIKIDEYIDTKIIPSIKNPLTRFSLGMARGAGKTSLKSYATPEQLKSFGIIDDKENVDVSMLQKILQSGFEASPELDMYGLVFVKSDLDDFMNFIGVK
mgnify:CR=1 FL=1